VGPEYEEAAETLGATRWQSFRKVVLPELSPALLAGLRCRLPAASASSAR
jgi:sulfate transport system permease protein